MTAGTAGVSGTLPWFSTTGAAGGVLLVGLFFCDARFFLGVVFRVGVVVEGDIVELAEGATGAAPAVEANPVGRVDGDVVVVAVAVDVFDTFTASTVALAAAAVTFGAGAAVCLFLEVATV